MSTGTPGHKDSDLSTLKIYVTTHTPDGKSTFTDKVPELTPMQTFPTNKAAFGVSWFTEGFPVDMNDEKDIDVYQEYLKKPPGLVINNGTVLRHVDLPPGSLGDFHRTVSLDFGICMAGEVAALMDDGTERILHVGDICVQRGTNHNWRNNSETEWARMLFVLQPSVPLKVLGDEGAEEKLGPNMKMAPSS